MKTQIDRREDGSIKAIDQDKLIDTEEEEKIFLEEVNRK